MALLRAINVGGTGKLPMADLKAMCGKAGFASVETYIASGNVVFESKASAAKVKAELERRLLDHAGKPIGVIVRTVAEMAAVLAANPFPKLSSTHTVAIFLDEAPPADALDHAIGVADETDASWTGARFTSITRAARANPSSVSPRPSSAPRAT